MKKTDKIFGKQARGSRPTKAAAFLLAVALSVPTFLVLTVIELAFL